MKEVIQSGKLGRIVLVKIYAHSFGRSWDWQTLKKSGGGELRNNAPHIIDQALQLLGDKKPEVFCDLRRTLTLGDAEDHVKITLRAPDSPLIDIEVTRACAYPPKRLAGDGNAGRANWKPVFFEMEILQSRGSSPKRGGCKTNSRSRLQCGEDSMERGELEFR